MQWMRLSLGAHLGVRSALLSDLQCGVIGGSWQRVPGVGAVSRPQHKQVVPGRPEEEVIGLGILECLQICEQAKSRQSLAKDLHAGGHDKFIPDRHSRKPGKAREKSIGVMVIISRCQVTHLHD